MILSRTPRDQPVVLGCVLETFFPSGAMGFSHETTTRHFTLLPDGGIIEVDIKADQDPPTRDQIRMHLTHIAAMFSDNNFDVPMFVHDRVLPGVPVMKEKHASINYIFSPPTGVAR